MAYPFGPMPMWGDFRGRLVSKHGCTQGTVQVDGVDLPYLTRSADGKTYTAVVQILPDDKHLTPTVIRSICVRLGLDVRDVEEAFTAG